MRRQLFSKMLRLSKITQHVLAQECRSLDPRHGIVEDQCAYCRKVIAGPAYTQRRSNFEPKHMNALLPHQTTNPFAGLIESTAGKLLVQDVLHITAVTSHRFKRPHYHTASSILYDPQQFSLLPTSRPAIACVLLSAVKVIKRPAYMRICEQKR